jgi:hypothetical protein
MHCPRCGQEQVSEDIKFCSRCGFPLGLVSEILAHGGFLPQLADLPKKGKKWLTRNFGLKIALLWFIVMCVFLLPLAGVTHAPGEILGFLAIVGFCGALLMTALSFMFLPKEEKYYQRQNELPNEAAAPQFLGGKHAQTALPPQMSQPVSDYAPPLAGSWKAPDTGELVPRSSVTEGTTRLLKKDE